MYTQEISEGKGDNSSATVGFHSSFKSKRKLSVIKNMHKNFTVHVVISSTGTCNQDVHLYQTAAKMPEGTDLHPYKFHYLLPVVW